MNKLLRALLVGFATVGLVATAYFLSGQAGAQTVPAPITMGIISGCTDATTLATCWPVAADPPAKVAVVTSPATLLYFTDGTSAWQNTTGFLPSVTITMPTTAVALGCATDQTVAIPNAVSFYAVPSANPGNVNVQTWITAGGTSGALAHVAYCTAILSITPASVTFTIKPFSR